MLCRGRVGNRRSRENGARLTLGAGRKLSSRELQGQSPLIRLLSPPHQYPRTGTPVAHIAGHACDVDRAKALELGITESDVASSLLTSLSGNSLMAPSFWVDPKKGVNYQVVAQTPYHEVNSIDAIANTPLSTPTDMPAGGRPELLGSVARIYRSADPAVIDHYTVQRVMDVNASIAGRDLGSTAADVQKAIDSLGKLPANQKIVIRGESQAMRQSFMTLAAGLVLAIVLVYLLMVANFQSWLEPFIITMAIPGALAGVLWMLIATGTTINVESLMVRLWPSGWAWPTATC